MINLNNRKLPTVTTGVAYRSDAAGSAHADYDLACLKGAKALGPNIGPPRTLPAGLANLPRPEKEDEAGLGQMNGKVWNKRSAAAPTASLGKLVEHLERHGVAPADAARGHLLDDVDGLYLAGAPSAVHSQVGAKVKVPTASPEDAVKRTERDNRADYEHQLIAEARTRGMPVLAVCAGSWRLLEAMGGHTQTLEKGEARKKHYQPGNGTWNTSHGLDVGNDASVLRGTIHGVKTLDKVNSTHWATAATIQGADKRVSLAPAPEDGATETLKNLRKLGRLPSAPHELTITATASKEDGKASPSVEVEAFETRHGAPMMGVQWHPESYLPDAPGRAEAEARTVEQAENLFKAFAQAQTAYHARQDLNAEFLNEKSAALRAHAEINS
jgi:putative glutamine amidotransferase